MERDYIGRTLFNATPAGGNVRIIFYAGDKFRGRRGGPPMANLAEAGPWAWTGQDAETVFLSFFLLQNTHINIPTPGWRGIMEFLLTGISKPVQCARRAAGAAWKDQAEAGFGAKRGPSCCQGAQHRLGRGGRSCVGSPR